MIFRFACVLFFSGSLLLNSAAAQAETVATLAALAAQAALLQERQAKMA